MYDKKRVSEGEARRSGRRCREENSSSSSLSHLQDRKSRPPPHAAILGLMSLCTVELSDRQSVQLLSLFFCCFSTTVVASRRFICERLPAALRDLAAFYVVFSLDSEQQKKKNQLKEIYFYLTGSLEL